MMTAPGAPGPSGLGDPKLWLHEHGDYLYAFAMAHVANAHLAEDLVQETLLAAIERRDTYESRSTPRTWLAGILKHKLVDHLRRSTRAGPAADETDLAKRVDSQFDAGGKWRVPPGRWDQEPGAALAGAELRAALAECLERLPARSAQVLLLAERQELSAERVGNVLTLTTTNVGVILHRARAALRRCLEERSAGRTTRDQRDAPMPPRQ